MIYELTPSVNKLISVRWGGECSEGNDLERIGKETVLNRLDGLKKSMKSLPVAGLLARELNSVISQIWNMYVAHSNAKFGEL